MTDTNIPSNSDNEPTVNGDKQPTTDAGEQPTSDAGEQPTSDAGKQPTTDAGEQPIQSADSTGDGSSKKSGWKNYFVRHPKQKGFLKILGYLYMVWVVLVVLVSIPAIRALAYPTFHLPRCEYDASFYVKQASHSYTSKESPEFTLTTSSCGRYSLQLFNRTDFVPQKHEGYEVGRACNDFNICPGFKWSKFESKLIKPDAKPVLEKSGNFDALDWSDAQKQVQLEPLPVGDYVAVFRGFNDHKPGEKGTDSDVLSLRITDLGLVTKQDNNQLLIYGVNLVDGSLQADVACTVYYREFETVRDDANYRGELTDFKHHVNPIVTNLKTGSDGVCILDRPQGLRNELWETLNIDANLKGSRAYQGQWMVDPCNTLPEQSTFHDSGLGEQSQFTSNYLAPKYKTFVNIDRPIYRLGDNVGFKFIVRKIDETGTKNIGSGQKVWIDIVNPDGEAALERKDFKTDNWGAFAYEVAIPKENMSEGSYTLTVHTPDGQSESFKFEVRQFRKPEFNVKVEPLNKVSFFGDKLRLKVAGNYYFGGPVTGASVKYSVSTSGDHEAKSALFQQPMSQDSELYYLGSLQDVHGIATTDSTGEAIIEIDTKELKASLPKDKYSFGDVDYEVKVSMTDPTNYRSESGSARAVCTPANLALNLKVPASTVGAGQPITVEVEAGRYEGQLPEQTAVKVDLCSFVQTSPESEKSTTKVASQEVVIGKDGKAKISIPTTANLAGSYQIVCKGVDEKGRTASSVTSVYITGSTKTNPLTMAFEKRVYKVGEEAKLALSTNLKKDESADVLVCVEGLKIYDYRIAHITGPSGTVTVPVRGAYSQSPAAIVTAVFVDKEHTPHLTSEYLHIDPASHNISLQIVPDKKQYRPADKAKFLIKATYDDGSPAANAALCFAMYDLPLDAVAKEYGISTDYRIEDSFFCDTFENCVLTRYSFQEPFVSKLDTRYPDWGVCAQVCLAPVTLPLYIISNLKMGSSYDESEYYRTHTHDLEAAGPGGGTAEPDDRKDAPATRAKPQQPKGSVEQAQRSSARTQYDLPEPRLRKNFTTVAAWFPNCITNDKGETQVTVALPDDVTAWKCDCLAIDTEAKIGSETSAVIVAQEIIARLGLPRFFTDSDKTTIEGSVHNYCDQAQTVNLTLAVTPQLKVGEPLTTKLTVAKDGVATYKWPVEIVGTGEASITLKAVGQSAGDALVRKLPCKALGYRVFLTKCGSIKEDKGSRSFPLNIPPEAKLPTGSFEMTLASSQIGPVLGSFESLIDYPYGCTEQTLSRLIPSVVAKRLEHDLKVPLSNAARDKFQQVFDMSMPKLEKYQHSDGGWGWWETDTSDKFMTAQVLEGFYLLNKLDYSIDSSRTDRGVEYLYSATNDLSSHQQWNVESSIDHAKAIYVLSMYEKDLLPIQKAWQLAKLQQLPPEALAYLSMAFKKLGDEETAKMYYSRLLELKNESRDASEINWDHTNEMVSKFYTAKDRSGDYTYRFSGVETTALALRAAVAMEPKKEELINPIVRWLIASRDENGWNNTKCTSQVFVAMLERELAANPTQKTKYTVRVSSPEKLLSMLQFDKPIEMTTRSVRAGINPAPAYIKIEKDGPGLLYYTSLLQYDRTLRNGQGSIATSKPERLKIEREFFRLVPYDKDKKLLTRDQAETGVSFYVTEPMGGEPLKAGDVILMRVSVDSPISVPYVLIESALPSGAEVLRKPVQVINKDEFKADFKPSEEDARTWGWWDSQQVLDDRMGFFVRSLMPGKCSVDALIKMERPGEFGVNPVSLQSMYSKEIQGYSTAHWLKVVD